MVQVPLLAMEGDRIIRRVGDAIRFVVADDETFLTMQELRGFAVRLDASVRANVV